MTLPEERKRSIWQARAFLLKLLSPKHTPRVPGYIRKMAGAALRHYPWKCNWTCFECGDAIGTRKPGICTIHNGTCDFCGLEKAVTSARKFGA